MRQATVPQFIDVEDKIIGPITVRQFLILIVAGLIVLLEYKLSDMALFLVLGIPTLVIFGIIAFLKVNGMPFHFFFLNVIQTFKKPSLRVWSREINISVKKGKKNEEVVVKTKVPVKKVVTHSRLSDLSLIIDTGGVYRGEEAPITSFQNDLKDLEIK